MMEAEGTRLKKVKGAEAIVKLFDEMSSVQELINESTLGIARRATAARCGLARAGGGAAATGRERRRGAADSPRHAPEEDASFRQVLDDNYPVKLSFAQPEKGKGIPSVEAVDKCDVIPLSQRREDTTPEQTDILKKALLKDRKPIVGIRQAGHAFNAWPEIDREVFGATYKGHFFEGKDKQVVQIEPKGKDHPLLAGFKPFMCGDYPYLHQPGSRRRGPHDRRPAQQDATHCLDARHQGGTAGLLHALR